LRLITQPEAQLLFCIQQLIPSRLYLSDGCIKDGVIGRFFEALERHFQFLDLYGKRRLGRRCLGLDGGR
jgi:hypothetical protein